LPALEAVIADIRSRGVERVTNLGDSVSGPLWPRETCDLLMSLGWPTVRGNCDREVGCTAREDLGETDAFAWDRLDQTHKTWLAALPSTIEVSDDVLACHGTPTSADDYLLDCLVGNQLCAYPPQVIAERLGSARAALTVCGHSHVPRLCIASDGRMVLNPGSVGLPAYDSEWDGVTYFAESGSPHARYAVIDGTAPPFNIDMIAISYDHEAAARRAGAAGRADYVQALRFGAMRTAR
jgi:predicted phosphodiesterase